MDIEVRIRDVYLQLSGRPIERQCELRTQCCNFQATGRTPYLTRGEALVAARAFRASGRTRLPDRTDGACPLLEPENGRCIIYENRPFACRTHFCRAAGGPYPRAGVADLIHELEAVDRELGGKEATTLPAAIAFALEHLPRRSRRRR